MTVSRELAQSLTRTIHLLRPAWSEAGIFAALSECKQLDATEVCLAAIRAASDPKAKTPGVIPTKGSHWNEPDPAPRTEPRLSRDERRAKTCAECGRFDGCAPLCPGFLPLDHAKKGRSSSGVDLVRQELAAVTWQKKHPEETEATTQETAC